MSEPAQLLSGHDLCERALGRQLDAAPDLERLHALRDALLGVHGPPERLDRGTSTPPPEVPAGPFGERRPGGHWRRPDG